MPRIHREIRYSAAAGQRGTGDLFFPPRRFGGAPVLLIHGGGWNALAKESIERIGLFFLAAGRTVFNVNYRLLDHSPWPACRDDCVAAARFFLDGRLQSVGLPGAKRVLVCGASAGGHLALAAGQQLGREQAEAIISIAGPSRMDFPDGSSSPHLRSPTFLGQFYGSANPSPAMVHAASPVFCVTPSAPPLYCIHSRNDHLVPLSHSTQAVEAWQRAGVAAELLAFDGPGDSHGIWDNDDHAIRQPIPEVAKLLRQVLASLERSPAAKAMGRT